MDNSALVKYYDPRTGKYEFATVLDVGDLSKLNTTIKTDLVSAINSLEGSGWGGGGEVPPELIDELENIKDAIASIKDGTFIIEEWGSFDQYFQSGIADAIEQLNIFNREQIVITVEEIESAIQESKDYYDQHLAETMQDVESARTDMANAQQTLNQTAQRLEEADLNYSEVTLKVDEIDQYIEGNIKSVKFDIVNAVTTEYESLVRQMEDEFGVNVEESFLSYLTGRVGKAEADISVQSGKIESKVGYDEFQYMPVEDIDQYNKNLLFHTMDFSEDWERNDVRAYITTDSFRHTRIIAMDISNAYYSSITDTLELGKTYTLSASFNIQPITKAPNEDRFAPTDGNYDVSAFIDGTEYPMVNLVENLTGVNGFKRLSVNFVSENENPEVYFRIKNLNAETSTGYMTAPKLEAGNESTPWQPHFDDEYATMLSTNSLVRQQGNEIVSLISSTKELGDKFVTATSSFQQLEDGFIRNAELIEEYEDAVIRYGMEVEELNDRITQKVWMDDFSDAVETISIDGKNRVLNSDFVDMSTDNNQLVLGSWENVDPLFTIEKIDGVNYAVIKRTGLTGNLVASMASNRFAVKNGERLMFGFDIIVETMPDVGNVFQIELLDINDIRVGLESFTLDQMGGDITLGEVSRLNYQYIINREDVAKARVRLMLTRNGHVKFTRVMAQQGTIKDTEWSPAPEDAQILRMKMQTEINQTAEQIQLLANDERLDAINDILYRKEGKLEVSPSEILARVTSSELGDDAVVTGTQLKLTDEALRFDLVGKDGLIQSINASEEELKIDFDRVEVNGMLIAKILSTEYLDVSQGFKIMNGSHMVLGISPNNDFIIDADRILVNSNQVLTTEDKDEINKKIDDSWIYQDPEGVIIGAISQELEKSKTDSQSTFSEMWSNITVNAEGIEAAVSKDGVIQSINLSNEEALIDFDKVRITGELLASLISAEKIDITDNFGIYYQDRLVFGVDAPTQAIHINSNNIMINGKRVAIIDDVLTVDGKVVDLNNRVDGHDTQLSNVAHDVNSAIAEAEAAKLAAQKAYEDAIEEAEAKVQAKDEEYKLIFEEYDSTVEAIEADTQTAKTKANQALIDVGISTDLAQTASDLATTAQSNASTAISNASQAVSDASGAVSQALSAFNLATQATSDVSTISLDVDDLSGQVALKANQTIVDQLSGTVNNHTADISANAQAIQARLTSTEVSDLVDGKGLAKVTYVDNQITATSESFGFEMTRVEGKIDGLQVGGRNLIKGSATPIVILPKDTGSASDNFNFTQIQAPLEEGETYTLSFDAEVTHGTYDQLTVIPQHGHTSGVYPKIVNGRVELTFTAMATTEDRVTYIYAGTSSATRGNGLIISNYQIEKGNIATDWSPAPEDTMMENDFTVFKNAYQSTVDGITSELSKTAKITDLNGMVTESYLATNQYTTQGQINTQLIDYLKTTDLNGKVKETVAYQDVKETTDRYTRVIGSTDAESRTKIAQIALTDSLFQTTVQNSLGNTGNLVTNPDFEDGLNGWENLINVESNDANLPKKYYARQASRDVYNLRTFPVSEGQKYRISYYRWNATTFNNETNIGLLYKTKDGVFIWQRAVTENGALIKKQVTGVVAVPENVVSARLWVNIGQYENFSPLFFTQVSVELVPDGMAYQSQVTQLANSWALTLKSGNDIKTQINASTDAIRLSSKFIHLNGSSLIDNATIKSAHIDSLNANKITGNTADFNTIRTGVLTANAVTSTHINANTALFDKLFSTTSATDRLSARDAWIKNANIISINADKITAGTISANRISTSSLSNVDLNNENLIRNSAVPQHGHNWQNRPDATITSMADGYEHLMSANPSTGNIFMGIGKNSQIPLEANTDYVYSMWIFAGANATVTSTTPLHSWVASGGINQGGVVDETRVLLSNSYIPANTWTRIVVRFKTVNKNDVKFTPMWYGSMYPNGIAVRVRNIQLEKGVKATDWRPSPYDTPSESKFIRSGAVEIHGGNIKADTLDVGAITGDTASFISAGFKSLNSQATINGNAIRIQNSAGEFVEMNNSPELRSDDAGGTAVVLGKGRVHFYDSRGHSKGYVGTDMHTAGSYDFGTFLSKGSGIYRFARMADATQTTYAYYTVKAGKTAPSSVITDMVINGYLPDGNAQQFVAKGNMLSQLNGWPNYPNWPTLKAGQQIRYKEVTSQTTGNAYEDIWKFGPSSNGDWRIYFAKHATFEGGTTGTSDRRLKHDIEPTQVEALRHIESLVFKEFRWNRDNKYEPLGLIAQDSGIVRVSDDDMEGIDIQRAIMLGLKGVQELQAIVKAQAEEIKQLKEINNQ